MTTSVDLLLGGKCHGKKTCPSNSVLLKLNRLQLVGTRIRPTIPRLRGGLLDSMSNSNLSPLTEDMCRHLLHSTGDPCRPDQGASDQDLGMSAGLNRHGAQADSQGTRAHTVRLKTYALIVTCTKKS